MFTLPDYYELEKRNIDSNEIKQRLKDLENNPETQKRITEFFWRDESLRFTKKESLLNIYRKRKISVKNLWGSYKKIFSAVLKINDIEPYNDERIWNQANEHLVIIDLTPYFTNTWSFPINKEIFPYLAQMLQSLLHVNKSNKTLIFFGADYLTLFYRLLKSSYKEIIHWKINLPFPKRPKNQSIYSKRFILQHKTLHERKYNTFFLPFPRQSIKDAYVENIRDLL